MSMRETIDAIHAQGGLAYVPHPFDRLHAVPDYEHLLKVVEDIDVLEVFNARVAVRGFNEEARRFAGPEEFLESLRDADILHKRKSLIYLQSLKLVQTKVRTRSGRRARPAAE